MLTEYLTALGFTDFLVGIAAFIMTLLVLQWFNDRKLPPGPTGLPFVGYLPFMSDKPLVQVEQFRKKYGPVISMRAGSMMWVTLADYPTIKDAFNRDAFMGRPVDIAFDMAEETIESGAFSHLPWKEQRKFSLHLLRDLGLGRSKLEGNLREEIQHVIDTFARENGKPVSVSPLLAPSTSNNIASLVFGKRLDFDDPKRKKLDEVLRIMAKLSQVIPWFQFFPFLKTLVKILGLERKSELTIALSDLKRHIVEEVDHHRESVDPNDIRDYIDGYLLQVEKEKENPKTTFKEPILMDLIKFFFIAGSDTVRVAMEWILLIMAAYPDVQKKVQAEIDDVIGHERFPSKSDSPSMPYSESVVMETLRWRASTISPPRSTIEDTEVNSYTLPKNTMVVASIWSVHHDPELWGEDVEQFKPERFLSEDGKRVKKPEYFIPFSVGKRSCPGESFALMEIFMYLTAILQRFNISLPKGTKPDLEDGTFGLGLQPKPFKLCFENRQ